MRLCSTRCGRESVVGFSLDGIGIADAQAVLNSGICADPKGNETLHQRRLHAASVIATVLTEQGDMMDYLPPLQEFPANAQLKKLLGPSVRCYSMGVCQIIVNHADDCGWHLSIAGGRRDPTKEEIEKALAALFPGLTMFYVESSEPVIKYCKHYFEIPPSSASGTVMNG